MKLRILHYLRELPAEAVRVFCLHPVEMLLVVVSCIGCLTAYRWDDFPYESQLALMPLFALLALAVNKFAGCGPWRRLYWVCWTPLLPLLFWPELDVWIGSWPYLMAVGVLLPLAVLMSRREVSNERFIADGLIWLRSAVLSAVFVNVALGLFCAILYSTTYIFGLKGEWITHLAVYLLIVCQTLFVPLLFLLMSDRWQGVECRGGRIAEVLLDYIVTPALLIYASIFYLYIAKILVTWSLPRGGVAYLVFGFMLLAMAVQALQSILPHRRYTWFFGRFGLIALPMLVLFWVGTVQRTGEYGLTEPRVWLVVCGGLMTLSMVLFLLSRTGRYLYICLAAFLVFGTMTFIPALHPERIANCSQTRRAVHAAERLGMLGEDGRLLLDRIETVDSAQRQDLRRLYEALDYISYRDTVAFARFGLTNLTELKAHVPESIRHYMQFGRETETRDCENIGDIDLVVSRECRIEGIEGYRTLYTSLRTWMDERRPGYTFSDDTLRVSFGDARLPWAISGPELLHRQLRRIGAEGSNPTEEELTASCDKLLTYKDDSIMILFSDMNLSRTDSTLLLCDVTLEAVLTR